MWPVADQQGRGVPPLNQPDSCRRAADIEQVGERLDGLKIQLRIGACYQMKEIARHQQVGGKGIGYLLERSRVLGSTADLVRPADQEPSAMMFPMPELMPE